MSYEFSLFETSGLPFSSRTILFINFKDLPFPMDVKLTIGDVAVSNGILDAIWCINLLPKESYKDFIRFIIPTIRRMKKYAPRVPVHEYLISTENALLNKDPNLKIILNKLVNCVAAIIKNYESKGRIYVPIDECIFDMNESESNFIYQSLKFIIEASEHVHNRNRIFLETEKRQQVMDICSIFPPISLTYKVIQNTGSDGILIDMYVLPEKNN